jgi:small-conductance mechanosensitive channel
MGWLDDVVEWLREAQLPLGTSAVSLWDMGVATVTILGALIIALWIGATVEARLAKAETMDQNLRVVFSRLVRAALIVVALMIGLSVAGIEPTLLTVFGGTLGVGLGLGFQRIASNYVSGFIILLDRSLRIGDLITVDKYHGLVSQIRTRYTVLRSLDGTEAIVPNEMLVSSPVTNLSYTDRRVRAAVKVSVAYQTDVKQALAMMEEAACGAARVLSDPPPLAMLLSFGADGLELEVGFWLADPEQGRMSVQSDVAQAILAHFRAAGIEIPYPQRDVRISGWNPGPSS